jgi:3-phosphoshikimate 1-carboxyvinyltransferase
MIIEGRQELNAATVDSFQDHRIAMAAAIGALRANGPVVLEQADAVNKSFPAFFEQLDKLRSP